MIRRVAVRKSNSLRNGWLVNKNGVGITHGWLSAGFLLVLSLFSFRSSTERDTTISRRLLFPSCLYKITPHR